MPKLAPKSFMRLSPGLAIFLFKKTGFSLSVVTKFSPFDIKTAKLQIFTHIINIYNEKPNNINLLTISKESVVNGNIVNSVLLGQKYSQKRVVL